MLSRRDLVGKLAAGAAAACAVGAAGTSLASNRSSEGPTVAADMTGPQRVDVPEVDSGPPTTLSAPVPWELVRPLAMGSAVTRGWHVAGLTGAVKGSCVLTLQNDRGRSHRVHICRNDGRPQGLVYTRQFDLIVMNGGEGDLPTDEGFAQAVAQVAHVLAANENGAAHVVTELMPHSERLERFASAATLR